MRKWLTLIGGLVGAAIAILAAWFHLPTLTAIGPGYSAQIICGCVFVSRRTPESCAADLDPLAAKLVSFWVAPNSRTVTAHSLGLVRRTARYRDGFGCALDD
jgi:hypothetical protein